MLHINYQKTTKGVLAVSWERVLGDGGVRLQRQQGVGVRWQKRVHEYCGLGRVSDMFGPVAVQVSSCSLDHFKSTVL